MDKFLDQLLNWRNSNGSVLTDSQMSRMLSIWSKQLTKEFNEYAKSKTPSWFGVKFHKQWTPFRVAYNKKEKALYLWGYPPNVNVDKAHKRSKRVPWAKTSKQSRNPDYQYHKAHYHRIFIPSSSIDVSKGWFGAERKFNRESKGFWFTAKNKWESSNSLFFSNKSHYKVEATTKGYRRVPDEAGRKYPFPAQWYINDRSAEFGYDYFSVSDKIMEDDAVVAEIIERTFHNSLDKISK